MATLITHDIRVSVEAFYQAAQSSPEKGQFVFSYNIKIQNLGNQTVKLLRRHWYIYDSVPIVREVEGAGVVGKQPILPPGAIHQYTSWSPLTTDIGKMWGTFLMVNRDTGHQFKIGIPEFHLIVPQRFN